MRIGESYIPADSDTTTVEDNHLSPPKLTGRQVAILAVHHVRVNDQTLDGGAEKYIRMTIGSLLDAGVRVHVGYSGNSIYDDLLLRAHPTQLTVEHTGWINDALAGDGKIKLATIRARRRWLRASGADTVFAIQQASGAAFSASLVAARSLRLRVITAIRQPPQPLPAPTGKRWLGIIPSPELWRRRLIWRHKLPAWCCDAIIFNSHAVAEAYHEQYGFPQHRSRIIYNGEGKHRRTRRLLNSTPCTIGNVGRITEAKGADTLFDAFLSIAEHHPETRLAYYGDGPLVPRLKARAQDHGLSDRVTFHGYQADHDKMYPHIDICVQPSRRESMSNSVVEAMARGIPCVVTDVGGMREAVKDGETGFVIPPRQPEACAKAVSSLLANRETFAKFSDASFERARRLFDIDRAMRETAETILGTSPEAI